MPKDTEATLAAFNIIMWGLVLSCFAAVESYSGAIAVRFFLGVFEAAVTPGFALFTSQWYTKKEQGTRTGIWFSFNGFAQVGAHDGGHVVLFTLFYSLSCTSLLGTKLTAVDLWRSSSVRHC